MHQQALSHTAYIGLGANLGDPRATIRAAAEALSTLPGCQLSRCSRLYLSAPIEAQGDDFVNAVVQLQTSLPPMQLLAALQQVEQQFGRERPYLNAPRTLDLDLLLYDNHMIDTAVLQVPHPRISQRAFVILPLLELDHTITIPGLGIAASFLPGLIEQRISVID